MSQIVHRALDGFVKFRVRLERMKGAAEAKR